MFHQDEVFFCTKQVKTMEYTEREEKHMSIMEMSEEDRPREKMLANGAEMLTNAELLPQCCIVVFGCQGPRDEAGVAFFE